MPGQQLGDTNIIEPSPVFKGGVSRGRHFTCDAAYTPRPDARGLLERAGYRLRGNRADCPHCRGHARLTVAVKGDLFFCHRCHVGGSIRDLAHSQGINLPPPRVRKADLPKQLFRDWLAAKMTEFANREHRLYFQAKWAEIALQYFPDFEPAWAALAELYDSQRHFEIFWQSVSDNIGRYWLYRAWRRHAR